MAKTELSYEDRAETHPNPVAKRLLLLMAKKKTNLCASLDVRTTAELLQLLDILGPYIAIVKTHVDIIDDFTYESTVVPLLALAKKHEFLIFEDRKFADIGSTVKAQYTGGVHKVAKWSDFTNAHAVPGPGVVNGIQQGAEETTSDPRGLILIAQLSSKGSLAKGKYSESTIDMARANPKFVFGFIAQDSVLGMDDREYSGDDVEKEDFLILTPGVGLDDKGDGLGQQYRPVDRVVAGGSDVIIVGRGLYGKGRDPKAEGKRYKEAGWNAYLNRINGTQSQRRF